MSRGPKHGDPPPTAGCAESGKRHIQPAFRELKVRERKIGRCPPLSMDKAKRRERFGRKSGNFTRCDRTLSGCSDNCDVSCRLLCSIPVHQLTVFSLSRTRGSFFFRDPLPCATNGDCTIIGDWVIIIISGRQFDIFCNISVHQMLRNVRCTHHTRGIYGTSI